VGVREDSCGKARDGFPLGSSIMESDLVARIRLGFATELALAGAYLRAESWIVGRPGTPLSHSELDLLARVYVQQERYEEAEACWRRALDQSAGDGIYARALDALHEHRARLRVGKRIAITIYVLMVAIGALAVLLLLIFRKSV
jgi:ferric-dicitrate binding protein FerR (iron transport regulator)